MTSDELAAHAALHAHEAMIASGIDVPTRLRVIRAVRDGILGDGRDQYEHTRDDGTVVQAFESKTPAQVVDDMIEEARDLLVYNVQLTTRLFDLRDALGVHELDDVSQDVDK